MTETNQLPLLAGPAKFQYILLPHHVVTGNMKTHHTPA